MPVELIWRQLAEEHLQSIFDYISVENPRAASVYIEEIIAACDRLRHFPQSGRMFGGNYRVVVVRNHLILYKEVPGRAAVIIAAVIDGRRDVATILDDLDISGE